MDIIQPVPCIAQYTRHAGNINPRGEGVGRGSSIPKPLNIFLRKSNNFRFLPYNMVPKEGGEYSKRFSNGRLTAKESGAPFI